MHTGGRTEVTLAHESNEEEGKVAESKDKEEAKNDEAERHCKKTRKKKKSKPQLEERSKYRHGHVRRQQESKKTMALYLSSEEEDTKRYHRYKTGKGSQIKRPENETRIGVRNIRRKNVEKKEDESMGVCSMSMGTSMVRNALELPSSSDKKKKKKKQYFERKTMDIRKITSGTESSKKGKAARTNICSRGRRLKIDYESSDDTEDEEETYYLRKNRIMAIQDRRGTESSSKRGMVDMYGVRRKSVELALFSSLEEEEILGVCGIGGKTMELSLSPETEENWAKECYLQKNRMEMVEVPRQTDLSKNEEDARKSTRKKYKRVKILSTSSDEDGDKKLCSLQKNSLNMSEDPRGADSLEKSKMMDVRYMRQKSPEFSAPNEEVEIIEVCSKRRTSHEDHLKESTSTIVMAGRGPEVVEISEDSERDVENEESSSSEVENNV